MNNTLPGRTHSRIVFDVEHSQKVRPYLIGDESCMCGECFDKKLDLAFTTIE